MNLRLINVLLIFIICLAAALRITMGHNLLLSGDEVGVGVLQATGQAVDFRIQSFKSILPVDEIRKYISHSEDHGVMDVFDSLRYTGMHPPFYYLMLHFVIKCTGNDAFLLRLTSIVFSLLAIYLIYRLGSYILNETTGLLAALFLAISPYCVQYNLMVRPYPFLMFLSLLSTLQIYLLIKNDSLRFNNPGTYLYLLTSIVGLYTLNHYIFIVAFHTVFVFLASPFNFKRVINNIAVFVIIIACFSPWIVPLLDQLEVVNNESYSYYFHGENDLISLLPITIDYAFFQFPFNRIVPFESSLFIKTVITAIIVIIFLWGCIKARGLSINNKLLISFICYIIIHYIGDLILETETLSHTKFQFFLIPAFFLLLSNGIFKLTSRYYLKMFALSLCVLLLAVNSCFVLKSKLNFDGPLVLGAFKRLLNEQNDMDDKTLVIINTRARRQLLSFVQAVEGDYDMAIFTEANTNNELSKLQDLAKYERVYLSDLNVIQQKKPNFTPEDLTLISEQLRVSGFSPAEYLHKDARSKLARFERE